MMHADTDMEREALKSVIGSHYGLKLERRINEFRKMNGLHDEQLTSTIVYRAVNGLLGDTASYSYGKYSQLLQQIIADPALQEQLVQLLSKATNTHTEPHRLRATERIISKYLSHLNGKWPLNVLDVGVGGYIGGASVIGVTTIELAQHICAEHGIGHIVFGGDIRQQRIERVKEGFAEVVFFPFDVLNPDEYIRALNAEFNVGKFDIIRCCNLIGHFREEMAPVMVNGLQMLGEEKAILLYNLHHEDVYTLALKENEKYSTLFFPWSLD